jgi:hypothetical protein
MPARGRTLPRRSPATSWQRIRNGYFSFHARLQLASTYRDDAEQLIDTPRSTCRQATSLLRTDWPIRRIGWLISRIASDVSLVRGIEVDVFVLKSCSSTGGRPWRLAPRPKPGLSLEEGASGAAASGPWSQ